jgi:hypothetical protein
VESVAEQGEVAAKERGEAGAKKRGEPAVNGSRPLISPEGADIESRRTDKDLGMYLRSFQRARPALAPALALLLAGCLGLGGSGPDDPATETTNASAAAATAPELDVRRYLGPDYCPEIRVREGLELLRSYEPGHEDEPAYVVWQASIGDTARECLYDAQGGLTLRIGVSGRVIAGPKGGPGSSVSLPLRIAVVKYQEATLSSELYPLSVTIPAENSTVFNEVREISLPSPGSDRDYIIYVGFDEAGRRILGEKEPEKPKPVVRRAQRPAQPPAQPAAAPAPQPAAKPAAPSQGAQPSVLPVPEGFVLPGG